MLCIYKRDPWVRRDLSYSTPPSISRHACTYVTFHTLSVQVLAGISRVHRELPLKIKVWGAMKNLEDLALVPKNEYVDVFLYEFLHFFLFFCLLSFNPTYHYSFLSHSCINYFNPLFFIFVSIAMRSDLVLIYAIVGLQFCVIHSLLLQPNLHFYNFSLSFSSSFSRLSFSLFFSIFLYPFSTSYSVLFIFSI